MILTIIAWHLETQIYGANSVKSLEKNVGYTTAQ